MNGNAETPQLSLQEIADAALDVARGDGFRARAASFVALVQRWANPTALLAAVREPAAESGWRLLPELTAGPTGPAAERMLARVVEEADPGGLTRPIVLRPPQEMAGVHVKPRDSWLLPWRGAGTSGFLLLRGLPAPYPSNLAEAVGLAAQPLWPLVPRPATAEEEPAARQERLEETARQFRDLASRLDTLLRVEHEQLTGAGAAPSEAPPAATDAAPAQELDRLKAALALAESARAALEGERELARAESAESRLRAEALQVRLDDAQPPAGAPQAAGEEARDWQALREKLAGLEQAQAEAEAARDQARTAAAEAGAELEAVRAQAESDRQALEAARQALKNSEGLSGKHAAEMEVVRRQRAGLQEQAEAADKARLAAEAERDRARAEVNPLWATIESLQRQVKSDKERLDGAASTLDALQRQVKSEQERLDTAAAELGEARRARDEAEARVRALEEWTSAGDAALAKARERAEAAEKEAEPLKRRWEATVGAFRAALQALRRTPFVPPTLRVSFAAAEAALDEGVPRRSASGEKPARILFLDRDAPALEPLAQELEAQGADVLIAHYPEEVSFFLRTPDARHLTALVGDVMAFRSDVDLLERYRTWRLDFPGLALLLSHRPDDPGEAERARRLPAALAAGLLSRPIGREALTEAITASARRVARGPEAAAATPVRGSQPKR